MTSAQAQCSIIRLTGTLTGNVNITMANINKFWTIDNQLTNSPAGFACFFVSTSAIQAIGAPPGCQDIYYDGTTVRYCTLPHPIGGYWDYAGGGVPTWVSGCSTPPYLNCDGTTFSSAAYPILSNLLGGNVRPDARGRFRGVINQGTNRMTAGNGGVDGNTILAVGGADTQSLTLTQIPPHNHTINISDPT